MLHISAIGELDHLNQNCSQAMYGYTVDSEGTMWGTPRGMAPEATPEVTPEAAWVITPRGTVHSTGMPAPEAPKTEDERILERLEGDVKFLKDSCRTFLLQEPLVRLMLVRSSSLRTAKVDGGVDTIFSGCLVEATDAPFPCVPTLHHNSTESEPLTTVVAVILHLDPGYLKQGILAARYALLWHAGTYPHGPGSAVQEEALFGTTTIANWMDRTAGEQAIEMIKMLCEPAAVERMLATHAPGVTEDDSMVRMVRADTDGLPRAGGRCISLLTSSPQLIILLLQVLMLSSVMRSWLC